MNIISIGDYHEEMNGEIFIKWLNQKLNANLLAHTVVEIDNAPYNTFAVTTF
jgi:transposase